MPPRKSAIGRLFDHFHHSPRGRFHEFLFFLALGGVVMGLAYWGYVTDFLNEGLSWILGIVGACIAGFGMLPQKQRKAPPPPPPGKRGVIAEKVKASKAERKKKGPVPPGPPIRRG